MERNIDIFRNHTSNSFFNKLTSLTYCYHKALLSAVHRTVFNIKPALYCFLKVEIAISPCNFHINVARLRGRVRWVQTRPTHPSPVKAAVPSAVWLFQWRGRGRLDFRHLLESFLRLVRVPVTLASPFCCGFDLQMFNRWGP